MNSFDHKYLIIDTSILCVWLKMPEFETCGSDDDRWDFKRVDDKINEEKNVGTNFVLPLASIIETGNHITHIKQRDKLDYANKLANLINDSIDNNSPWVAFSNQKELWNTEGLRNLTQRWLKNVYILSLGDASIVDVAEHFSSLGNVEIFSGDQGLRAYEPKQTRYIPRRRQ